MRTFEIINSTGMQVVSIKAEGFKMNDDGSVRIFNGSNDVVAVIPPIFIVQIK